jgi:hypothetical protein
VATTIPNFLTNKVVSNLDTYTYTVTTAAMHVAKVRVQKMPPSGLTITIQQNGSTKATVTVQPIVGSTGQSSQELHVTMNCAVSDVISFVLSSSTAIDQGPNAIKATLDVHVGSGN